MIISKEKEPPKCNSIDLCKIIMAICVVAIHTNPLVNCSNARIITFYELVVRIAVPFFFLSSGYLLALRFNSKDINVNIHEVKKYLYKIVKMYLVWNAIYLPLAVYHDYINGMSLFRGIVRYVRNFIFVGEHYNSWHLWYLLSTIYALVFVIALLRMNLSSKSWLFIIGVICLISTLMDEIVKFDGTLPTILWIIRKIISQTTLSGRILQGFVFIPIGILMVEYEGDLKKATILFMGSFVLNYCIDNSMVSSILLAISAIALYAIILHINLKDHPFYFMMRKISTDVYLVHMYVWTFYYVLMYKEKQFGWDSFAVTTVVSLMIGIIHFYLCTYKKCV